MWIASYSLPFRSFIRSPFDSYGDRRSLSEFERDQLIFLAVIAESFSSIFFSSNLQRNIASVLPSNTKAKKTLALRFLFSLFRDLCFSLGSKMIPLALFPHATVNQCSTFDSFDFR